MIDYITGVPGSGKSYYAIFKIVSNFSKDEIIKKDKKISLEFKEIDKCLTNINNLDLSKFNNVESLNFDSFKSDLTSLHDLYKLDVTDEELIEEAKKFNLFNIYIVLDECHNFLGAQDKILIWWLSYHRHLHQEITLITQNLSLVNSKYKAFSEFFLKAVPASRKLFNTSMKYKLYIDSRMSQKSFTRDINIPIVKDIFNLYTSGANVKGKNVIYRFLIIMFFLALLVFFIFYYLYHKYTSKSTPEVAKVHKLYSRVKTKPKQHKFSDPLLDENKKFYSFKFVKNNFLSRDIVISKKLFYRYQRLKKIYVVSIEKIGKYKIYDVLVDELILTRHELKSLKNMEEKKSYENNLFTDDTFYKSIFSTDKK